MVVAGRLRPLVAAFTAALAIFYTASLDAVACRSTSFIRALPFGDVYLQSPWRFRYGALLALAVLAGLGVEAWREAAGWRRAHPDARARPGGLGRASRGSSGRPPGSTFLVVGAVVGAGRAGVVARRPAIAAIIPVVLAIELIANGLLGQAAGADATSRDAPATWTRASRRSTPLGPISRGRRRVPAPGRASRATSPRGAPSRDSSA